MPVYKIDVTDTDYFTLYVEADSEGEATDIVDNLYATTDSVSKLGWAIDGDVQYGVAELTGKAAQAVSNAVLRKEE